MAFSLNKLIIVHYSEIVFFIVNLIILIFNCQDLLPITCWWLFVFTYFKPLNVNHHVHLSLCIKITFINHVHLLSFLTTQIYYHFHLPIIFKNSKFIHHHHFSLFLKVHIHSSSSSSIIILPQKSKINNNFL